jgi:hypothetical protein
LGDGFGLACGFGGGWSGVVGCRRAGGVLGGGELMVDDGLLVFDGGYDGWHGCNFGGGEMGEGAGGGHFGSGDCGGGGGVGGNGGGGGVGGGGGGGGGALASAAPATLRRFLSWYSARAASARIREAMLRFTRAFGAAL